ncbi:MAG TPA: EpsG family protein [Sphingomicrobium sp.]|nr:EpsG family protein [Sphingomicrobium sp.]
MFPYWFLFGLFALGALVSAREQNGVTEQPVPALTFCAILMALMIGLRYEVGADWGTYSELFTVAGRASLERVLAIGDPGYQLLNWIIRQLGGDLWQVNLICALIFCWGLLRLAQAQPKPWLAMVVAIPYLVTVVSMGYTRQAVAIGILMAGLASIQRGASVLHYVAYIAVAALFHKTVVVAIPLVLIATHRNVILNVILAVGFTLLFYNLFLEESVDRLVRNYVDSGYSSQGAAIRIALNFIPAALYLIKQDSFGFSDRSKKVYRYFSYAAVLLPVALVYSPSSTAIDRLALYILPLQLVILSRLPLAYRIPGVGTFLVTVYSALILFVWLNFAKHAGYWLPYQIWPFQ